jgi:hypothetical protein
MSFPEILILGYVAVGGLLWLYVIMAAPVEDPGPIGCLGYFSELSGLTHLLFLVLWPVWFPLWLMGRSKLRESEKHKDKRKSGEN